MGHEDKGRDATYSTPLPPPRPSFNYAARPSTDSIRSLADHSYSPLFTNGLYNSSIMDLHRPNPPSPPAPAEHLVGTYPNLPDPSTFSTPAKKKSSSSLISSLGSKSPFSRRRTRKQSSTTITEQSTLINHHSNCGSNNNTPGKNSSGSSQSSLRASPGKRTSPYKSPLGKQPGASWKRREKETELRGVEISSMGAYQGNKGKSSTVGSVLQGEFLRSPRPLQMGKDLDVFRTRGAIDDRGDHDQGDVEMIDVEIDVDPAMDLQNDISALETINGMLGLPIEKSRPAHVPKKKRSLLGFAARGGSKVPFVDEEGKGMGESVGRKSGGWVRASMEHFSRDAPTPPPMTPLPPLPQKMMDKLALNSPSTTNAGVAREPSPNDSGRRTNLKPFRLRSLLNLNMHMGTPKKQQSTASQMHASPASFVGGGRYSPGESPSDDHAPFSSIVDKFHTRNEPQERAGLELPPRPGTSLGLCTPKKQIIPINRSGSNALGITSNASTPVLGLPMSNQSHWSNANPVQGRNKMSMGPNGRMPPPRPSSRPSWGPEKILAGRPRLSESRERALSPTLIGRMNTENPQSSLSSRTKIPLLPRSSSNTILSDRSNADKRAGKVFGGKAESPTDGLPFKNGDGWSTPYPISESVDIEIGKSDMGYPFPAIPKIKSRSSSRAPILESAKTRDPGKTARSRFDSSAFEYQAFETDHLLGRAGKESRESSPPLSGTSGYETTKSSGMLPSRPGSTIREVNDDKENQGGSGKKNAQGGATTFGRSRPLPAIFHGGRESRGTMRG